MSADQPLIVSNIHESADVLRARFQEWGYLYIKNYVSQEACNSLLHDFVDVLAPHIALDAKSGLPILTGEPFAETEPTWDVVYPKMQALESFHAFFHAEPIKQLMQLVADDEVFVYPMKMARISTPNKLGFETPPHQDARSHVAGPTMAGFWVALHDITTPMGRLKVLPKSHIKGVREIVPALGVGNVQCEIFPEETTWHVSDVEQGDVIIFHSCTVHAAQPNVTPNIARMSVDTRFCDYGAPVYNSNMQPHHAWRIPVLDWEYIYRDWQNKDLQYYWKSYPAEW
jgi:ectoine hydroxylase-related dioxygenase (phytanoyl-CoA dioxygenase family)